jgi:hypothetical protein
MTDELLTIFARNAQEALDDLKLARDSGGTLGCISSMDKGLGNNIEAHIEYIAHAKHLLDVS